MVSPSKVQYQEQKQLPGENKSEKCSHTHSPKNRKPLDKKSFYLDIKNYAVYSKLEARIKELGGVIELFLVRNIKLVVTDRVDKLRQNIANKRNKWARTSGGSGGPPSLKSIEVPTPTPTPPTPFLSSAECPLSNSTNLWGQTTQRSKSRVDAMLERALIQPQQCSVDPLDNAQSWGIPIWTIDKLQAWLDKIYNSLKDTSSLQHIKQTYQQHHSEKSFKVRHLKRPYIKFESFQRDTRPVFLELPVWPLLNFDSDPGSCPFDAKKGDNTVIKKENKEIIDTKKLEENKEMTRRPRTTTNARTRKTEQLATGYCEICRADYRDLKKHVQSDQHLNFVKNDDNFLSLDSLINTGASVEAFLQLNRTKDIGKDCNLFPNGDSELHNDLPDDKTTRRSKSLNSFEDEDLKMVQCNGARRNPGLKLSSPHNLRTRAKHESGHLLRSKGSPWHETEKTDKLYENFQGYTIKKRAKGTIWLEEDDPEDKVEEEEQQQSVVGSSEAIELKHVKQEIYDEKILSRLSENHRSEKKLDPIPNDRNNKFDNNDTKQKVTSSQHEKKSSSNSDNIKKNREMSDNVKKCRENLHTLVKNQDHNVDNLKKNRENIDIKKIYDELNGDNVIGIDLNCKTSVNGVESNKKCVGLRTCQGEFIEKQTNNSESQQGGCCVLGEQRTNECDGIDSKTQCRGSNEKNEDKNCRTNLECLEDTSRSDKPKNLRTPRRGGGAGGGGGSRTSKARQRLSVEERLIEDNRAYYKVEVLGSKLRSSIPPGIVTTPIPPSRETNCPEEEEKKEIPSSEKPVVVRFKRVRKSELSLLSDEAESFMFGEPKRDESCETSDGDQSSVLPKDTESECNDGTIYSSPLNTSSPVKQEVLEEDSQDSSILGRARKRRRTQAEKLLEDNTGYYKFETPGSRLRYQAPLTGIRDTSACAESSEKSTLEARVKAQNETGEKIYPSKPSPEVEKMQFSFEAVPKSESWYQTYQRQDQGAEFWHSFSEGDLRKPFLLPYEIENFHETLIKYHNRGEGKKKGKGRHLDRLGRSPRKSPRCHASTLAIMSTIIRKREQQQEQQQQRQRNNSQNSNGNQTEEPRPPVETTQAFPPTKSDPKSNIKCDVDEELREIAKTIDDMLNMKNAGELEDSFEADIPETLEDTNFDQSVVTRGPPSNLFDLLNNCHEMSNCLENSSCASSECGEGNVESPLKKRKKRKNRTGWPGNKLRKKLQVNKSCIEEEEVGSISKLEEERRKEEDGEKVEAKEEAGKTEEKTDLQTEKEETTIEKCEESLEEKVEEKLAEEKKSDENNSSDTVSESVIEQQVNNQVEHTAPSIEENQNNAENAINKYSKNSLIAETEYKTEKGNFLSEDKLRKSIELGEISENDPGNSEKTFRKDLSAMTERQFNMKIASKKKSRVSVSSDTCETENQVMYSKNHGSEISPRKHNTNGAARRRAHSVYRKNYRRKRMHSKTQQQKNQSSDTFEDENCKKNTYLSINCRKKRQMETIQSTEGQETDYDCPLSERISPPIVSCSELKQRRSSIDFQPVVRMMKIEDQVDMDHSILSVTVASNRRLRSSSSPRSSSQPPKKRLKTRGQFGRWLKNS